MAASERRHRDKAGAERVLEPRREVAPECERAVQRVARRRDAAQPALSPAARAPPAAREQRELAPQPVARRVIVAAGAGRNRGGEAEAVASQDQRSQRVGGRGRASGSAPPRPHRAARSKRLRPPSTRASTLARSSVPAAARSGRSRSTASRGRAPPNSCRSARACSIASARNSSLAAAPAAGRCERAAAPCRRRRPAAGARGTAAAARAPRPDPLALTRRRRTPRRAARAPAPPSGSSSVCSTVSPALVQPFDDAADRARIAEHARRPRVEHRLGAARGDVLAAAQPGVAGASPPNSSTTRCVSACRCAACAPHRARASAPRRWPGPQCARRARDTLPRTIW